MAVENATNIDELNEALPDPSDALAEGDDHIRLMKSVLKAQLVNFPAVLDWTVQVIDRFDAIETRLDALDDSLANDIVQFSTPGGDSIVIAGSIESAGLKTLTSLTVDGVSTFTGQLNAAVIDADTVNADNINAEVQLTSDGNVIAFSGS